MKIKEFERATGLKRSTIRFYEAQGLIEPETGSNGYRYYDDSHVEAAKLAKLAQWLGFSIREIAELGKAWRSQALSQGQKVSILRGKLIECRERQEQLQQLVGHLQALVEWVEDGERAPKPSLEKRC